MKPTLLLAALLLASAGQAQHAPYQFSPLPLDARTHRVTYVGTRPVPEATAAQLRTRAAGWPVAPPYHGSRRQWLPDSSLRTQVALQQGAEQLTGVLTVHPYAGGYHYQLTRLVYQRPGYAQAGKHTPATVAQPLEQWVYTRPSRARTRRLARTSTLLQQLLADFEQTMSGRQLTADQLPAAPGAGE